MSIPIYKNRAERTMPTNASRWSARRKRGKFGSRLGARPYPGRRLARNALPGVRTLGFWDADHRQDWGLGWHRNEGIELTFLESGEVDFAVDNRSSPTSRRLDLPRPWQQHRVGNPHVGVGQLHFLILDVGVRRPHQTWRWPSWLLFTADDLRQLTGVLRHNEQPVWHAAPEIARCFNLIGAAIEADREGSSTSSLAIRINQLFLALLEMFRGQEVKLDESFLRRSSHG